MTAQDLIRALDAELDGASVHDLDNSQLSKLEGLLYHWQSVAAAALADRLNGKKSETSEQSRDIATDQGL